MGVNEQDRQLFINRTSTVIQVNTFDIDIERKPTPQDEKNTTTNDHIETVAADINR